MRFSGFLDDAFRDLRYGLRVLTRSPLFTLVAVFSLAIGIGGAASVFTVMNAVLLRNLPVPNPQQLVSAEKVTASERSPRFSWPQFEDARRDLEGRAELAVFTSATGMNVRSGDSPASVPERRMVQLLSGEFFQVLRQQPQAGRLLSPSDNATLGAHPVAVISDACWERLFRRAPDAIGRTLVINGTAFTIVGVTAPGFFGAVVAPRNPEIWVPLMMQPAVRYASNASSSDNANPLKPWPPQREIEWLHMLARVSNRNDLPAAASALTVIFRRDSRTRETNPDAAAIRRIEAQRVVLEPAATGVSSFREDLTTPLVVLLAMVGILLAIACGNVASLLIGRANARDREIAIRLSIGARRTRLVRQLLAETMLLAAVGGAFGLLAAAWGKDLLLGIFASGATTIDMDTSFDWRVLGFVLAVTALTGLAAGIMPALRGSRVALADSLNSQGRSIAADGGRRGAVTGKVLVAAQIAFCLLLLVLAVLFARSMRSLLRIDVGYDRDRILVSRMDVRSMGLSAADRQALYARITERLSSLPGVTSSSISLNGPLGTSQRTSSLGVEGYTPARDERMTTNEEIVTDKYFETVGLEIVEGRGFAAQDRTAEAGGTIINQAMARRFFPNGSAIGKRWNYGGDFTANAPVVIGVVQDAKYLKVRGPSPNMIYRLSASTPDDVLANLEVRTSVPPVQLVAGLRRTLAESEPGLPVYDVVPLEDRVARGLANDRLVARLTAFFGGVALLLACLGLYGTISYGVTRRVTELGVRMALGAARSDVLWLVMREASLLVLAGAAVGIPLAYLAATGVRTLLYGVQAIDAVAYLAAAGLLILVGGIAAFLPAHRASRIDPMVALRQQ